TGSAPQSEIETLYSDYLYQWANQCAAFRSEVEFFRASEAYTNYRLTSSRSLRGSKVIPEAQELDDEVAHTVAVESLKSAQKAEQECWDGIPTLEKVRKLVADNPRG